MFLPTALKQTITYMTSKLRKIEEPQLMSTPLIPDPAVESTMPITGITAENATQEATDMATIQEMRAQLAELQRQIAETTQREKADTIAQIKQIMSAHGLTMADIAGGGSGKRGRPAGGGGAKGMKVAPKYRDPVSGKEWTGRGVAPT